MRHVRRISTALALFALCATSASAQQRRITGRVTGEGGEPLTAASVSVVGTPTGAYTAEDGSFSILAPDGTITLRVRRIGYQQKTVPVPAGQSEVNVSLTRDVLQLETQVVTGVATTISRRNATNDVAQVTGEELNRAPTPTVENALQGKIAGANIVTNSGAPGGGAQFRIRGASSILGNSDPLLVVDGVIISNEVMQPGTNAVLGASAGVGASSQDNGVNRIADLNPADIENIEVLKGASASNIYGSRASNGVIIITTKRGSAGKPRLNLTQRLGAYELSNKLGSKAFSLDDAIEHGSDFGLTEAEVRENYERCKGFCDHEDQLYGRSDLSYETNASLRGGGQNTTYFISGLAKHDAGIAPNSGYNKQSLRVNLNQTLTNRITAAVSTNLVHSLAQRSLSNNDNVNVTPYFVLPVTPSYFDLRARDGKYPDNPFTSSNPLQTLNMVHTPEEVWRLLGSGNVDFSLLARERQTLTLRLNGGIDQYSQQNSVISPRTLQFEPGDALAGTITLQSGVNVFGNTGVALTHTYQPAALPVGFTTSIGSQYEYRSQRVPNIVTRDVLLGQENIQRGAAIDAFDFRQRQIDLAFYAQEQLLAFDERLLLDFAVRGQRSTVNGDPKKFYAFPKAAASYRVPTFVPTLNEVKLRLAYGVSGNPPLATAPFTPLITGPYDGRIGVRAGSRFGSPDIKPERQNELEGGVDIAAFSSRASLAITGYERNITDLLLRPAIAPSQGITALDINGGKLRNRGLEITLGATPFQTASANYITRLIYARNYGKVLQLPDVVGRVQCLTEDRTKVETNTAKCPRGFTGGAFGFALGQGRLEEGASPTQIVGTDTLQGGVVYQRKYGDTEPSYTLGWSNEFNFRGFRLYGLLDWRKKFSIVNLTQSVYDDAGLNPDTAGTTLREDAIGAGLSPYIEDGSFVKLREVTLSYTIPARYTAAIFGGRAQSASLELSGRNLATWTKYPGLDPEVSNFGNTNIVRNQDLAPFPPSRSYFFSVNLGF